MIVPKDPKSVSFETYLSFQFIEIKLDNVDTEESYDFVTVIDGPSTFSPRIATWSGDCDAQICGNCIVWTILTLTISRVDISGAGCINYFSIRSTNIKKRI